MQTGSNTEKLVFSLQRKQRNSHFLIYNREIKIMSASEIKTLMREMGMTSTSSTGGKGGTGGDSGGAGGVIDSIKVDHGLSISFVDDAKWEKYFRYVSYQFLELSKHIVLSIRIVAIASSISLVLWGTSKLIESIRKPSPSKEIK
jgi:hypothetical protein